MPKRNTTKAQTKEKSKVKKRAMVRKSGFVTSERAPELLEIVENHKDDLKNNKISKASLYRKLLAIDPNLPTYNKFLVFLSHLEEERKNRTGILLNSLTSVMNDELKENNVDVMRQFVETIYQKLFAAGNAVISQELEDIKIQIENGIALSDSQKKNVMQWFFKGVEGMQKDRALDLQIKADDRAQSFMDTLMQNFQYGKAKTGDIIDGEVVKDKELPTPAV